MEDFLRQDGTVMFGRRSRKVSSSSSGAALCCSSCLCCPPIGGSISILPFRNAALAIMVASSEVSIPWFSPKKVEKFLGRMPRSRSVRNSLERGLSGERSSGRVRGSEEAEELSEEV